MKKHMVVISCLFFITITIIFAGCKNIKDSNQSNIGNYSSNHEPSGSVSIESSDEAIPGKQSFDGLIGCVKSVDELR